MGREFGVIVFGASGFTGKRVMVEMAAHAPGVKWAAAGRSADRVKTAMAGVGLLDIEVVVADCADEESMDAMCARADVIINCTGPFRFYGEAVVKACVNKSCDYVDITGEPEFMEKMELLYDELAKEKRVHIVNCCGFDSIPADEGMLFTTEQFGYCARAESFLALQSGGQGFAGHATTFECVVHGVGAAKELKKIRAELAEKRPRPVPFVGPKLKVQDLYTEPRLKEGGYVAKFPGADASVVRRSELFRSADSGKPQSQYGAYVVLGSLWNAVRLGFHQKAIETAISFDFGKKHVLEHPGFWTAGAFSHEGPSEEQMAATSFDMTFYASGFSEGAMAAGLEGKPDKTVVTRVSGPEPGYVATPIFVVAAALTCLEESKKMGPGGVFSPSLAFKGTGYRQKLIKRGIKFEVLEEGTPVEEAKT